MCTFSFGSLLIPYAIFGTLALGQEDLGTNGDAKAKSYTDCEGYKKYTESQGISKEDADSNSEAVNARVAELQSDIIRNPWSEAQQVKIDENECLKEIRIAETVADGTFPEGLKPASEVNNSTETVNYVTYSNKELGISFEYPSNWNVQEKTSRFSDAPADVEVSNGLNSFKYQLDKTGIGDSNFLDLELMADMTQNSLLGKSENSLVEGVDLDKHQIDGKDTATFLIKTDRSFGDYATQVFIIDVDDRFDAIMYQDTVTRFDTPSSQEELNHILDSFKFIDSGTNDKSNNDDEEDDRIASRSSSNNNDDDDE